MPIPTLSSKATSAAVFENLHSASLLSVGQLCDDDCQVTFDKKHMNVYKDNKNILTGTQNKNDGLWDVQLPQSAPLPQANVIIRKYTSIKTLIPYLQACCFSPAKSTFLKAIKNGNFLTWPGLTAKNVNIINLLLPL